MFVQAACQLDQLPIKITVTQLLFTQIVTISKRKN